MPHEIRPLTPDDFPDLSRFLTEGFHAPSDARFAAIDVLRWKYWDPAHEWSTGATLSYLARDVDTGRVVGHVGVCPTRFHGGRLPANGISALHGIDWLGSEAVKGVGAKLLWRSHKAFDVAYIVGASDAARVVTGRAGYEFVAKVPVVQKVLNVGYRLRVPGDSAGVRVLRAAKDWGRKLARPGNAPRVGVDLRPVDAFGDEVRPAISAAEARAVVTSRDPGLLNHMLRYPRGGVTGWHVVIAGELRGFGVLSVVPRAGSVREGRVVECLLDTDDPDAWHAALDALTRMLAGQGADVAIGFASTPITAHGFSASGFIPAYELDFSIRDRDNSIPRGAAFHLTPMEADYGYV
jgi:hypothetical protein